MPKEQTVIYAARSVQDAHLLRNLLVEVGIRAVVSRDAAGEGSAVGQPGPPVWARVLVAEQDASMARQIALDFDRRGAPVRPPKAAGDNEDCEARAAIQAAWPRCPQCDALRITRCPICGTAGTDFSPADTDVSVTAELDAALRAASPSCGPGGCTPTGCTPTGCAAPGCVSAAGEPAAGEGDDNQHAAEAPSANLLVCPTCDEPFAPQHARVCEWCGHRFADGYEVDLPANEVEHVNARVVAVLIGLIVFLIAAAVYFMLLV